MNFMDGILKGPALCAAARARSDKPKRFDWVKAATILKERNPEHAIAGLQDDMKFTAGLIWNEHKPVPEGNTYVYLSSQWATPILVIDDEEIECWTEEGAEAEGSAHIYWPEDALKILSAKTPRASAMRTKNKRRSDDQEERRKDSRADRRRARC